MTDKDWEKLNKVRDGFTKLILQNQFEEVQTYRQLAQDLAEIIKAEMKFKDDTELRRAQMGAWGPQAN